MMSDSFDEMLNTTVSRYVPSVLGTVANICLGDLLGGLQLLSIVVELFCASKYMIAVPGAIVCDVSGRSRRRNASKHDCCCVLGAAWSCP